MPNGALDAYKAMLDEMLASRDRLNHFPYVWIEEDLIRSLCADVLNIFANESTVLELQPPIVICGDTHGQFPDTFRIFEVHGMPPETQYLFLGDYVDRGSQSIENLVFLLLMKVCYPSRVHLLRGNHESEGLSTEYGFRDECITRYSYSLYSEFIEVFLYMPFVATVGNSIFCVHGGIPSDQVSLDDLKLIKRPVDFDDNLVLSDLLWADPSPNVKGFEPSPRGISHLFGKDTAQKFLKSLGMSLIVRSHEFNNTGVVFPFGKNGGVVTIFSASNYTDSYNSSAVMKVEEDLSIKFTVFRIQPTEIH